MREGKCARHGRHQPAARPELFAQLGESAPCPGRFDGGRYELYREVDPAGAGVDAQAAGLLSRGVACFWKSVLG